MAKDSGKRGKLNSDAKDKDIHVNVVGVPTKNVDVKKTYPRDNNEDYQMYRISIDTKGKQKERKRRLSSLEPASKRTKDGRRGESNNLASVSSDDSFTDVSHSRRTRPRTRPHGEHREKQHSPKPRRKGSDDSEICFTIPGEKGKAIRIVGSSTVQHEGKTPPSRENSAQRAKRANPESPSRQVGFARLDEVYGTSPEESSLESGSFMPYRQTSPKVYNVENASPNLAFKSPTNRLEEPSSLSSRPSSPVSKTSKQGHDRQPESRESRGGVKRAGSHSPEHDKPSTSRGVAEEQPEPSSSKQSSGFRAHPVSKDTSTTQPSTSYITSDYEPTSGNSVESKGKYPFYPYDKQKRSKPQSKQFQEPTSVKQEDKELQMQQKLPSIPEVRSTEHYPSESQGISPPKESSGPPTTKAKEDYNNSSQLPLSQKGNNAPTAPTSSKLLKKQDETVPSKEHHGLRNLFKHKKPIDSQTSSPKKSNESKYPSSLKVKTESSSKPSLPTTSSTQRGPIKTKQDLNATSIPSQVQSPSNLPPSNVQRDTSKEDPTRFGTPRLSNLQRLPQKASQPSPSVTPKMQKKDAIPIESYNVKSVPPQLLTPTATTKNEQQNKPNGLTPSGRQINSPLQESSANKLRNAENLREPVIKKDQAAVNNKTPARIKQPVTADKEVNTETPLKPKERIMQEINEELKRSSSPMTRKSLQGSAKQSASTDEKDPKRTKSKLSSFVSSIPKPSFRRNKSLEKKSTDKSVALEKSHENPDATKGKVSLKDGPRKPVEESAIIKQTHDPVVEAYPAWVTEPDQQQAANNAQPGRFEDGRRSPEEFFPYRLEDTSSVEIANRSYGEHPLARKASTVPTVTEPFNRSSVADEEEEAVPPHLGGENKALKRVDSESGKVANTGNRNHLLEDTQSSGSIHDGMESPKDFNNHGKSGMPFAGPNVMAYPGQLNEQTPFGYESKYAADPEIQALSSLEDAFEAHKKAKQDNPDPSRNLVDRNPSLVSRAARNSAEEFKKPVNGHPIQVLKGSTDSQLFPGKRSPKELIYDPIKNTRVKDIGFEHGKKENNKSPVSNESMSQSTHSPTSVVGGEGVRRNPLNKTPFGKAPEEQVYFGSAPEAYSTYGGARPEESKGKRSPQDEDKNKPPTTKKQGGPKGILIFVNKKNEKASPFEKSSPPSLQSENQSPKTKNKNDPKKKSKREPSTTTTDPTTTDMSASTLGQSSSYASGDKKATVERSPSGRKTTQRYPCGCIRVVTADPRNHELKSEEVISAFCKDGSKCDVSKSQRSMLGRSIESSSISWEGSPSDRGGFPDIEVIADGILSRKPIKARPPAPTMNGAKLTGSFKIKSNKVNGVCNFYLDRKLKNYLRNNMDKIKQLLEDDDRN